MRVLGLTLSLVPMVLAAQDATEKELLDLLNTPVTVASSKAMTLRESPGVITAITREEIQASGARDLIDVLRMVPGLDFAYDTQGATGLVVRGLWAYEGKALLLWNGVEMPELLYGNTLYGHHFPVDQIKRIEVIRGPGSALYGGLAELAVIKVTTLGPEDLKDGGGASVMFGQGTHSTLREEGGLMASSRLGDGNLTLGASYEQGLRSDDSVITYGGLPADSAARSTIYSKFLHASYVNGGLQARLVVDDYQLGDPNAVDANAIPSVQKTDFAAQNFDVRYDWDLGSVRLTPVITMRNITPWNVLDTSGWHPRNIHAMRYGLNGLWQPIQSLNLSGGLERRTESAQVGVEAPAGYHLTNGGLDSADYDTTAAYLQAEYSGPVNLILGGRYEKHSEAGSAFVPRAAITKVVEQWHFKLLYANAFRTPNIGNLARPFTPTTVIEPEKTSTFEAEVGRQVGPAIITLNAFQTRLEKPLVWKNSATVAGYINGDTISTRGAELDFKLRQAWGFLNASYAMHQAVDKGVPDWIVSGHDSSFLGVADQKLSVLASIRMAEGWTLNPSVIYMGERYGYDWDPVVQDLALKKFKADALFNLNVAYASGRWNTSLGVMDAGDAHPAFLEAYQSDVPLHGPTREIVFKLRYGF